MLAIIVANRKKLMLGVGFCCLPYASFGMEGGEKSLIVTSAQPKSPLKGAVDPRTYNSHVPSQPRPTNGKTLPLRIEISPSASRRQNTLVRNGTMRTNSNSPQNSLDQKLESPNLAPYKSPEDASGSERTSSSQSASKLSPPLSLTSDTSTSTTTQSSSTSAISLSLDGAQSFNHSFSSGQNRDQDFDDFLSYLDESCASVLESQHNTQLLDVPLSLQPNAIDLPSPLTTTRTNSTATISTSTSTFILPQEEQIQASTNDSLSSKRSFSRKCGVRNLLVQSSEPNSQSSSEEQPSLEKSIIFSSPPPTITSNTSAFMLSQALSSSPLSDWPLQESMEEGEKSLKLDELNIQPSQLSSEMYILEEKSTYLLPSITTTVSTSTTTPCSTSSTFLLPEEVSTNSESPNAQIESDLDKKIAENSKKLESLYQSRSRKNSASETPKDITAHISSTNKKSSKSTPKSLAGLTDYFFSKGKNIEDKPPILPSKILLSFDGSSIEEHKLTTDEENETKNPNLNESQLAEPLSFQKRFMSSGNPYLKPQDQLQRNTVDEYFKEPIFGKPKILSKLKITQLAENLPMRFALMKFYSHGTFAIPLKSLVLKFYLETVGDETFKNLPKEHIDTTKYVEILDVFWNAPISDLLSNSDYLKLIPLHLLELIGSSAVFLINNMSEMKFDIYKQNLCKNFLNCCHELINKIPNSQKYMNYCRYYNAYYLAIKEEYKEAWVNIIKCENLSDYIDGDGLDKDFYKQELEWIKHIKNRYLSDVMHLHDRYKKINDSEERNERLLEIAREYLGIAEFVEKIRTIENKRSSTHQLIEDIEDVAYHYLEHAKCIYAAKPEIIKMMLNPWNLKTLSYMATHAKELAKDDGVNKNILLSISIICSDIVLEKYRKSAENGRPEALFKLGHIYETGDGVVKDLEEAARCYKKAADKGHAEAQANLGAMHQDGAGVEQSYELAAEYYLKAEEQGHADAQCHLGWLYEKGLGVEKNFEYAKLLYKAAAEQDHVAAYTYLGNMHVDTDLQEATDNYQIAAEKGDPNAQVKLGIMYYDGSGVPKNTKQAVYWSLKSAAQNVKEALFIVGLMYQNGYYVKKNNAKALEYYKRSAAQGYAEAQFQLGLMHEEGKDVTKNLDEAVKYYTLAADQDDKNAFENLKKIAAEGHAEAQASLGRMHEEDVDTEGNLAEAIHWYELSVAQGNANAQRYLGLMYIDGYGVKKNIKKGLEYMEAAAAQGNPEIQYELGTMYEEDEADEDEQEEDGIPKNNIKAREWYQAAADGGHGLAQYWLASIFFNAQDYENAIKYYEKAAKQGDTDALFYLGLIYMKNEDYKNAFKWFEEGAVQGHVQAQYNFAGFYEKGLGVTQNLNLAMQWYQSAANRGHVKAHTALGMIYEQGTTFKPDLKKAAGYYQYAAEQGEPMAQLKLSLMYKEGRGVQKDPQLALFWCEESAEQNNAEAFFNLGLMHEEGSDVLLENLDDAVQYYKLAAKAGHTEVKKRFEKIAEDGHVEAQVALGYIYEVDNDIDQAIKWYEKAVAQGHKLAKINLGMIYADSVDIEKNGQRARQLIKEAAEGDPELQFNLGVIFEKDTEVPENLHFARYLFQAAATAGHPTAISKIRQTESYGSTD